MNAVELAVADAVRPALYEALRSEQRSRMSHQVARSPWLDDTSAMLLLNFGEEDLASTLAANPVTSANILALLVKRSRRVAELARVHPHIDYTFVQGWLLAELVHPQCPEPVLEHYLDVVTGETSGPCDQSGVSVVDVLSSARLSPQQAGRLLVLRCSSPTRERAAAWIRNPHAPLSALEHYADTYGTADLGYHPNADTALLQRIFDGPRPEHGASALSILQAERRWAAVVAHPQCPQHLLAGEPQFLSPGVYSVWLQHLLTHPRTPMSVLGNYTGLDLAQSGGTRDLPELCWSFAAAHGQNPSAARVLITLAPSWTGTLPELLETAHGIIA